MDTTTTTTEPAGKRARNGSVVLTDRMCEKRVAKRVKRGKTVDEIIEERIEWMKTNVKKPDGEMRPRIETWGNVASHLRRFVGARLGKKLAGEVSEKCQKRVPAYLRAPIDTR